MIKELFKQSIYELGIPITRVELLEEPLQTYLEIATEDVLMYIKEKNKQLSDNLELFIIEKMFLCQTKLNYVRMKTQFGDPNDGIDYEKLYSEAKEQKKKLFELIDKS